MKRYISDLHFFHEKLNRQLDRRGFPDAETMNAHMIAQWNAQVAEKDEVYILGDFAYAKGEEVNSVLRKLKGTLYLIEGNHDALYLKDKAFDASRFVWIRPYAEIHDNQRKVVLCHYPVFCYNGQNRMTDSGKPRTYMLYGHVHNSGDELLVNRFIDMTRRTMRSYRLQKPAAPGSEASPVSPGAEKAATVSGANAEAESGEKTAPAISGANAAASVKASERVSSTGVSSAGASEEPARVLRPIPCNMINCFCMFSDYVPLSLDDWIRVDEDRRAALS